MAKQRPIRRETGLVWSSDDGDLRRAQDPGAPSGGAGRGGRGGGGRDGSGGSAGRGGSGQGGGRVKVRRETAGRRGKTATTVSNVPLDDAGLRDLAKRLKKRCGVGGSAKDGVIEIQGDHRDVVVETLRAEGFDVVLAGG
ncbi:stress response translation initiation inhibitor YciH [Patulibacter sp. SYSU D01012]|uniref:translation initiation factor n=1 Tax=Patulibacter sp. SYSU D01012 TaxID=2817381 RepID=UPI001B315CA6|nr:stress response translation initiation inhibitor YciH [Patulibacter sp. SYSU D01012]